MSATARASSSATAATTPSTARSATPAFAKVDLDPGETAVVELALTARDLRLTTTLDIVAPPPPARLDGVSTLQEWLADPTGCALLRKAVGTDEAGRPKGILGNQELLPVIGNFPISTLAAFPGLGITHQLVHTLVHQISAT